MTCEWCKGPMPPRKPSGRPRVRLFCCENCRKRAWEAAQPKSTCSRCGGECSRRAEHCAPCAAIVDRLAHDARVEDVAEMYNAGMSIKAIGLELGYGERSVAGRALVEARQRGLIGYRYGAYEKDGGYQAIRASVIEGCYVDGWPLSDIAEVVGVKRNDLTRVISELRKRGADIPHRYAMENGRRVAA